MKTFFRAVCLTTTLVANSTFLWAQWPPSPNPRTPKTATGQPDLNAPAPRTPDGKPDLSGVWENPRPAGARSLSAAGTGGAPPPPGVSLPTDTGMNLFRNIG